MRDNSDFDVLFPGVAADINRMGRALIEADANPTGVALAMIIAGSELLSDVAGAEAAKGALAGALAHIEAHTDVIEANRERLAALV